MVAFPSVRLPYSSDKAPVNFSLTLKSSPESPSHLLAINVCESLISKGHRINQVFFYENSVYAASSLLLPDQDELNVTRHWQSIAKDHQVKLYVCVAAASRRGIINAEEAKANDLEHSNVANYFEIAGLGQWVETLMSANDEDSTKLLTF